MPRHDRTTRHPTRRELRTRHVLAERHAEAQAVKDARKERDDHRRRYHVTRGEIAEWRDARHELEAVAHDDSAPKWRRRRAKEQLAQLARLDPTTTAEPEDPTNAQGGAPQ